MVPARMRALATLCRFSRTNEVAAAGGLAGIPPPAAQRAFGHTRSGSAATRSSSKWLGLQTSRVFGAPSTASKTRNVSTQSHPSRSGFLNVHGGWLLTTAQSRPSSTTMATCSPCRRARETSGSARRVFRLARNCMACDYNARRRRPRRLHPLSRTSGSGPGAGFCPDSRAASPGRRGRQPYPAVQCTCQVVPLTAAARRRWLDECSEFAAQFGGPFLAVTAVRGA
jgi:hypothetical protein